MRPGHAGLQRFFRVGDRAFCLYCVTRMPDGVTVGRASLDVLNQVLASIRIDSNNA
jgi:hypothetical protein